MQFKHKFYTLELLKTYKKYSSWGKHLLNTCDFYISVSVLFYTCVVTAEKTNLFSFSSLDACKSCCIWHCFFGGEVVFCFQFSVQDSTAGVSASVICQTTKPKVSHSDPNLLIRTRILLVPQILQACYINWRFWGVFLFGHLFVYFPC